MKLTEIEAQHSALCATVRALAADNARLREDAEAFRALCRDDNANNSFERVGEMYARDTGYLRPGKSDPERDTSDRENVARFQEWFDAKFGAARAALDAALAARPTIPVEIDHE